MALVLVVDDEDGIRKLIRLVLHRSGHAVIEAGDGTTALKLFRETPVDLVITDLVMPDIEGLELIKEMKKIRPDQKILAISGAEEGRCGLYLEIAKKFGAHDALCKPFGADQILKAATALMEN